MDSRRARGIALAALAVVAVTLVAAAAAPVFLQEQGSERPPSGQTPSGNITTPGNADVQFPAQTLLLAVLVVGATGLLVQFARDPLETLKLWGKYALAAVAFVALLTLVYRNVDPEFFANEGESLPGGAPNVTTTAPPPGGGFGEGTSDPFVLPLEDLLLLALVAGAAGVLTLLAWRSGALETALRSVRGEADDGADDELEGAESVADLAGRAADRVEAAPTPTSADNAIYAAWREMLELLDVSDPRSATPRQFADAATAAGMDAEDVAVLTDAFEAVRYGEAALSTERREAVAAALRRIERTHRRDGPDGPQHAPSGAPDGEGP